MSANDGNDLGKINLLEYIKTLKEHYLEMQKEISRLEKERDLYRDTYLKMREAVEFYSSENNWQTPESQGFHVDEISIGVKDMIEEIDSRDSLMGGNFARQAIKEADEILKEVSDETK